MHFKQPQMTYTNRWRSLQCSGGGDEMGGEETRLERLWRVAAKAGCRRKNEMGSLDLKEWKLWNTETLSLNDLRCIYNYIYIYIVKTASFLAFINAQNDAPLTASTNNYPFAIPGFYFLFLFYFNIYIYIYIYKRLAVINYFFQTL
jgi:hypothetical protein